jgi:phosphatidylinositol glycan class O
LESTYWAGNGETGCWHPKQFEKAVVIIIDALRYDFTVPFKGDEPRQFHNAIPLFYETAIASPQNAILFPFIADPPTTTLQRLKGLTTGTLPTFIDAGSNFAGTAIDEDNIVAQLKNASKKVVHLGDDTWSALFPNSFEPDLTHAYDSFNVWDLHTVDNGVTEHLIPLLQPANASKWDVIFGHYLGVDHAGHRYGPDHPAMNTKLKQMDQTMREVMELIDDDTLLIVMGDHGMDAKGDHGGESDDEIEAAIWMYSKQPKFGRRWRMPAEPPVSAKYHSVAQVDFVPTISLLLGLPIPFNNLGAPIVEAFIGADGNGYENLARVNRLAAAQIHRYMAEYALVRRLDESATAGPARSWKTAQAMWRMVKEDKKMDDIRWNSIFSGFFNYQNETIQVCRMLWARFDVWRMGTGIFVLAIGLGLMVLYARGLSALRLALSPGFVKRGGLGLIWGAAGGAAVGYLVPGVSLTHATVLTAALGGSAGLANVFYKARSSVRFPWPTTVWSWVSVVFTVALSLGFAANSFTIWEDEILTFFLSSVGVLFLISSLRQDSVVDTALGSYHSVMFVLLTRLASMSRLCREEQMPFCRSTYYASSTSSTSANWQLSIPFLVALLLPTIVGQFYENTRSLHHSAILWYTYVFRAALALGAVYWTINAADDGEWFDTEISQHLGTAKVMIAQIALGISIPVGYSVYIWAAPFLSVQSTPITKVNSQQPSAASTGFLSEDKKSRLQVLGYNNAHGTRYFILPTMYAAAIIIVQKPMGAGAIALMLWQILSLLEILHANKLKDSPIGPIVLALLGGFHYFKTGHQYTLASLQWDAAFVATKTVRYPWSPILIVLNTYGPQILACLAVPAVPLWKAQPRRKGLLAEVAKAMVTHWCFYGTVGLCTAMWAGWLRRHLMLYRVFSPRFLLGAGAGVVVEVVGICLAVFGTRWSFLSIGEVFGVDS